MNEESKVRNGVSNTNWKDARINLRNQEGKKNEVISDVTKQSENKQSQISNGVKTIHKGRKIIAPIPF